MSKEDRQVKRVQKKQERVQQKRMRSEQKAHQKAMRAGKQIHRLGGVHGVITEYPDGTVEYRTMGGGGLPAFVVKIQDVSGISGRRPTKDDKKQFKTGSLSQIITVQGSGTVLGETAAAYGTLEKLEHWFRRHPGFRGNVKPSSSKTPSTSTSLADELTKLAGLKEAGILTDEEFETQKKKLLEN